VVPARRLGGDPRRGHATASRASRRPNRHRRPRPVLRRHGWSPTLGRTSGRRADTVSRAVAAAPRAGRTIVAPPRPCQLSVMGQQAGIASLTRQPLSWPRAGPRRSEDRPRPAGSRRAPSW
jgi:hypothetical protein